MKNVLNTCTPRASILRGTFNPEVFTAALMPVIQYYRTGESAIDEVYTNGEVFFRDATYPSEGLTSTITNVFRRISGDGSAPSIYRAETGFGGGKTHLLIGCTHIAERGTELANVTSGILPAEYLPAPHSISVVGIAGDEISVRKNRGAQIIPHTLWGEIAYQIGGEELYKSVRDQAEAQEAPGAAFLEKVLGGRKVLIMLDEMAQYAVRVDVAQQQGAANLAAFLMTLYNYAKSHTGIAVIITLAGSTDAFSNYTALLKNIQTDSGETMTQDDVATHLEKATRDITSVTMRDATGVTPVSASEIASVLAKRLFTDIDSAAAEEIADAYYRLYQQAQARLPEEACRRDYRDRIARNYPFHPTLVDFLNNKLSQAENFQGTRGVLRVLAMTIRSIWTHRTPVLDIQASDLDLHNNNLISELLGRTGNDQLKTVLTADVGSEESTRLAAGMSNAQNADRRNPHPDHIPMYENTWKVVFLNSLVGRTSGQQSNVFGVNEKDAIFMTSTPLLTPPQVEQALKEISESAFYLRFENGKYFAALEPTINSILASIRRTITDDQINQHLKGVVNRMITSSSFFEVIQNVKYPQDVPDNRDKPLLCVIGLDAGSVNVQQMYTWCGTKPRIRQNSIVLLSPKTVTMEVPGYAEQLTTDTMTPANEAWNKVNLLARQVLAIRLLKDHPGAYGINPNKLRDPEFVNKDAERSNSLNTMVNSLYTTIWYPVSGSHYDRRELHASGTEGSIGLIEQIIDALKDANELVSNDKTRLSDLESLSALFFSENRDYREISDILDRFYTWRTWPILTDTDTLRRIINEGVSRGIWIAYKMPKDSDAIRPVEMYTEQHPVPMSVDLLKGYSIVSIAGAIQRRWTENAGPDPREVAAALQRIFSDSPTLTFHEVASAVQEILPRATGAQIDEALDNQLRMGHIGTYTGQVKQTERPDSLITGYAATMHTWADDDVLITQREQAIRGWLQQDSTYDLDGNEAKNAVLPLLKRMGSLYVRGAKSVIQDLDITDMKLPHGGRLRLDISEAGPEDMKLLGELLTVFQTVATNDDRTEVSISIHNPDDNDLLMKELKGRK